MKLIAYSINMLILLTILPFISCGNKQADIDKQNSNQTDSTKQNTGAKQNNSLNLKSFQVIIKPDDSEFKEIFGEKSKSWTPDENSIEAAEKLLYDCYAKEKTGTVNRLFGRTLDEYNRQYVGAIDENGDKIIWINCFARPEKDYDEWKHKLIIAFGGGNTFFSLKVNVAKNTFDDLKVNGNK